MIKKAVRFISLAALFLIPIFPLIVADSNFFPFITGKAFYFRVLVEVAFFGWLMLALIDTSYRPRWSPITIGVTVFAAVTLVADLLGVNPVRSIWSNFERMEGWLTVIHLWGFYIAATGLFGSGEEGRRNWLRFIACELGVAFVVSIYGLLQLGGVLAIHQGSTRIDASIGNAAYMAVYMLINVGLAAFAFITTRSRFTYRVDATKLKVFWTAALVALVFVFIFFGLQQATGADGVAHFGIGDLMRGIGAFAGAHVWKFLIGAAIAILAAVYPFIVLPFLFAFEVFETATRGTILGLIGATLLALFLYAVLARGEEAKKRRWISAGAIVLILAIGAIFWTQRQSAFVQQNEALQRMANISWSEAQGQARNYIWPMALKGAAERPIFGWGQENFNYVFNANYNPKMWSQEQWFDRAHSVFLDWLVAGGILGLLAYLALYVLGFSAIWKSSLTLGEKSVLTGMLAGYVIHNIFVFDNLTSYVLFFTALGLIDQARGSEKPRLFGERAISGEAFAYIGLPVAVILMAISIYFLNSKPIKANHQLIYALSNCASPSPSVEPFKSALDATTYLGEQEIREQYMPCADRVIANDKMNGQTKQAFFDFGSAEVQNQIDATKWADARIYTLGGSFYSVIGQFGRALPLLERAAQLSPGKQSIDVEYATALINVKQVDKALEVLKRDYEAAPANPYVQNVYALALVVAGKEAEARKLFGDQGGIFDSLQMAQAYTLARQPAKAIDIYKKLLKDKPNDLTLSINLARLLYESGRIDEAVAVFRGLQAAYPQYKDAIEKAIQEVYNLRK